MRHPERRFDAVVIGEPQRAFYGNQFGLTFPVFVHYGIELWVPEVGGAVDPGSEAHDLVMTLYGGMSKGERTRVQVRVKATMSALTQTEGRYLGGRPPYGYRLADAGAHPHPGKAADGRRLHRLEPDPDTAPIIVRIFAASLAGDGVTTIARQLTADGIACPSAHDPARNPHRAGDRWQASAVRAILINPRYTGRQVWNRQRTDEVLVDVDDVALGHHNRQRWNPPEDWVWSTAPAHEPLVKPEDFDRAQAAVRTRGDHSKFGRAPRTGSSRYRFRGLITCALCRRPMQGSINNGHTYYRCRAPRDSAHQHAPGHPATIYLREDNITDQVAALMATAAAGTPLVHRPPHNESAGDATRNQPPAHPDADPAEANEHYRLLGLRLTYDHDRDEVAVAVPCQGGGSCVPSGDRCERHQLSVALGRRASTLTIAVRKTDRSAHRHN